MAGDVSLNSVDGNDCCRTWKEKYGKLEEKRNALRKAVKLLEMELTKVQAECATLKDACELERAQAEGERKEKEKLVKVQAELEDKICSLNLEMSLFQDQGSIDGKLETKVKLLEANITKGEAEIKHLKELFKKEKSRAELEKKIALSENKRAGDAWKAVESEKSKADEERKISEQERKKFEQCRLEVERLKKEVEGFRSRLAIEAAKYEETSKKHELERQRTMKEKKRADKEKAKADEKRKLADESNRKCMEVNAYVVELREEVEAGKLKIMKLEEDKNKLLGYLNGSLLAEKDQADKFANVVRIKKLATGMTKTPVTDSEIMRKSGQLEAAQKSRKRVLEHSEVVNSSKDLAGKQLRIETSQYQEQIFQKLVDAHAKKSSRSKSVENAKLKLCKEQLKLEKMKAKHAKEVLDFERCRNSILSKEIQQMRFDFGQYSRRLDMLDSFVSPDSGTIGEMGKNVRKYMDILKNNQPDAVPFLACSLADTELFQPSGRGSSSDFVSGTDPQLEFSNGGSLRKKLPSSAMHSAVASFTDKGFLGSQDRACSPATIAKMVEDKDVETQGNRKVMWPTKSSTRSSLRQGGPRIESVERTRVRPIEPADCRDAVRANASKGHVYGLDNHMECREESSGGFCRDHDGVTDIIEADFNCMRLLELDNATDENLYKIATERLLSPLHDSDLAIMEANEAVENVSLGIGPLENDSDFVLSTVNAVGSRATESNIDCPAAAETSVSSFGKQHAIALGAPEFCVISSDVKDIEIISDIFKVTRSCMALAASPFQIGCPVPTMSIISSWGEKLQAKEKLCVFFSGLLLRLMNAWPGNSWHSLNKAMLNCIDSFNELLLSVMADDKTRRLFEEECQIDYLLHIIEDFIMDGRVALYPSSCSRPIVMSIRDLGGTAFNGNCCFPSKTASTSLLVGGGIVLASICAATNNIGFVCEASYRVFQMHGSDTSLLLTLLHALSYLCGTHYFTSPSYGTLMAVLKSLVTYTEDSFMSESSGSCPLLLNDGSDVGLLSCIGCPFREEAASVDDITFLLLEKVMKMAILPSVVQYDEAGFCFSRRPRYEDVDRNNACGGPSVVPSKKKLDNDLNHNIELLSLLELVANVVGWEFTQDKIMPSLLSIFSSCISVPVAAGIMVLISHLGRMGVAADGFDNVPVDTLRNQLCDIIGRASTSNASLTVQAAVLNALLSLLPIGFVNIVEDREGALAMVSQSQSLASSSIRKWYSSLSEERQVLARDILQSTPPDKLD